MNELLAMFLVATATMAIWKIVWVILKEISYRCNRD